MAASAERPIRVLTSEGSSPSARESLNGLGRAGSHAEVIDGTPFCFARFSRFCRRLHASPRFGVDPRLRADPGGPRLHARGGVRRADQAAGQPRDKTIRRRRIIKRLGAKTRAARKQEKTPKQESFVGIRRRGIGGLVAVIP